MNLRLNEEYQFAPPRRAGFLYLSGLILVFVAGAALGLYQASRAQLGPIFLLSLLPILVAVVLVPFFAYQLYGLQTAYYILERDGLRLRWGLRIEHIPMNAIIWVHRQAELTTPLPKPVIRFPGAVTGVRHLAGVSGRGWPHVVEYMTSETHNMLLVGTDDRIFAISPSDCDGFLYAFQRLTELGSLSPMSVRAVYPSFLLYRIWNVRTARLILLSSLVLSLLLLVWVSLAIPARSQVHLGFYQDGSPGDLVPAVQLLLLPVLNGMIVLFDFLLGLFFFRREETQALSYLLWGSGAFIALVFLFGTLFILQAG
jgi:hypothetical protein